MKRAKDILFSDGKYEPHRFLKKAISGMKLNCMPDGKEIH